MMKYLLALKTSLRTLTQFSMGWVTREIFVNKKNKEIINLYIWPGISLFPCSILRLVVFDKLRTHCFIAQGGVI